MTAPTPYYDRDGSAQCTCGCGSEVASGRQYVSGHNLKTITRTEKHNAAIGTAQKNAWATKRKRMPIGSTWRDNDGYIRVKVVAGYAPWVKEHVLVAEEMIGRKLVRGEIVHHINGNRSDNRPENLFVCRDRSHHSEVHQSEASALRELLAAGLVIFREGKYEAVLPR